jgi:hypothetical protein
MENSESVVKKIDFKEIEGLRIGNAQNYEAMTGVTALVLISLMSAVLIFPAVVLLPVKIISLLLLQPSSLLLHFFFQGDLHTVLKQPVVQ